MKESDLGCDRATVEPGAVCRDWEAVFNAAGLLALIIDPAHNIVLANRAAAEAVGMTREELVGRKCHRVFHHAESPPPGCPAAALGDGGSVGPVEMELEALNRPFWVFCSSASDQGRPPARIIHLAQEATGVKRPETGLREELTKYKALTDHLPDLFWTADLNLRTTFVSPAVKNVLGFTPAEWTTRRPEEIMTPRSLVRMRGLLSRELAEPGRSGDETSPSLTVETEHIRNDGSTVQLENRITVVRDQTGQALYLAAAARDATEARAAERLRALEAARVEQARKMEALGVLSGGVAHGFNNILAIIMGYAELTALDLPEDDLNRTSVRQIVKSAARGKDLIDRILTFSRQGELSLSDLNLNQCVKRAMEKLTVPDSIRMELNLAPDLLPIRGDRDQLEQVVVNLGINAVEAMPDGGVLTVATANQTVSGQVCELCGLEFSGRYAVLRVTDSGVGIAEQDLRRVFDPFFTTKSLGQGTGLGLSVTYGVVAGHDGHIWCRSRPGRETVFEVYLPVGSQP